MTEQEQMPIGPGPIANPKCETCVFKVVDYDREPCASCIYGQHGGRKKNYVKTDL